MEYKCNTTLFPFQRDTVERAKAFNGRCILALEMGLGKAILYSAKVLKRTGWTTIGELNIGDEICADDGKFYPVTGIYPQGVQPFYKITFNDGTTFNASYNHLWQVTTSGQRFRGKEGTLVSTEFLFHNHIRDCGKHGLQPKYSIPLVKPVEFSKKELPIAPYLLGALLANGCFCYTSISYYTADEENVRRVKELLPDGNIIPKKSRKYGYGITNTTLNGKLRELGLMGCHSYDKFIPSVYLFSDYEDRLALLRGLMDNDGTVGRNKKSRAFGGTAEYSTSSERLCNDIVGLVRSLGGIAKVHSKIPKFTYRGERKLGRRSYTIRIKLPEHVNPFLLSRKAELCVYTKYAPLKTITKVEKIEDCDCCCIKIDSPSHLFVTNDYIVTHNTMCAITYIMETQSYPAIIVCPASLKYNWQQEFFKHYGKRSTILSGTDPDKYGELRLSAEQVFIINYDILYAWLPKLKAINPAVVVLDECHYVKSTTTRRTKACAELCMCADKMLALSGTPMTGTPMELYSILNMLLKGHIVSKWQFMNRYTTWYKSKFGIKINGTQNEEELNTFLKNRCMIRYKTEEVLKDLPPFNRQTTLLEMTKSQKAEYETLKNSFAEWMRRRYPDRRVPRSDYAQLLTQFGYMKRVVAEWKIPAIIEQIETFLNGNDGKLIIFGIHRKILDAVWKEFSTKNTKRTPLIVRLDGSTPMTERNEAVQEFQNNPRTRLFLGQLVAAGVGLTLTASHHTLFTEVDFVPSNHTQAEARNRRIGSEADFIHYNYLLMKDSIEELVCDKLFDKQQAIDRVIDGQEGTGSTFNLVSDLLRAEFSKFTIK